MEGLVLEGPGRVVHHRGLPEPGIVEARDAVVAVHLAGLCGSDLHPYQGRERVRPGVVPGHEAVGEVVAVGDAVDTLQPGDRVLVPFTTSCGGCSPCRQGLTARCEFGRLFGFGDPDDLDVPALHGAQATAVRVPLADTTAIVVPDGVDDRLALLSTDNLPTAWEAVRRADPPAGGVLAVVGLGAVGLCAVAAAAGTGVDRVVAVDPVAGRRELAHRLGAAATYAPDDPALPTAATRGDGIAAVVEAAGTPAAQRLAFDLLRPGGTLSVIAVQTADRFAFTPVDAYDRNLTVRAGRASVRATLPDVLTAVAAGAIVPQVTDVLTHVGVSLHEGPGLYRRFADREAGLVKAAFDPRR